MFPENTYFGQNSRFCFKKTKTKRLFHDTSIFILLFILKIKADKHWGEGTNFIQKYCIQRKIIKLKISRHGVQ